MDKLSRATEDFHRPWPVEKSPWIYTQTRHHVLFAHWIVDYDPVRAAVPEVLALDSYAGQIWVSVVAFDTRDFRPRGLPALPGLSTFAEINLRTYVVRDDKPGIYAFSLDTNHLLAVFGARTFFHLNYYRAQMTLDVEDDGVRFVHERASAPSIEFHGHYWPTSGASETEPGSLLHWLSERYCIYSVDRRQRVYRTEINHPPWCLQAAALQLDANTLGLACGLMLSASPSLIYTSRVQPVVFWPTRRLPNKA